MQFLNHEQAEVLANQFNSELTFPVNVVESIKAYASDVDGVNGYSFVAINFHGHCIATVNDEPNMISFISFCRTLVEALDGEPTQIEQSRLESQAMNLTSGRKVTLEEYYSAFPPHY